MSPPPEDSRDSRRAAVIAALFLLGLVAVMIWLARNPEDSTAAATATAVESPAPTTVFTQFVAEGPLVIGHLSPDGRFIVQTQIFLAELTPIELPAVHRVYVERRDDSGASLRGLDGVNKTLFDRVDTTPLNLN